jgi:hypothetical protein
MNKKSLAKPKASGPKSGRTSSPAATGKEPAVTDKTHALGNLITQTVILADHILGELLPRK